MWLELVKDEAKLRVRVGYVLRFWVKIPTDVKTGVENCVEIRIGVRIMLDIRD